MSKNKSALYYAAALGVSFIGLGYSSVPLYRMFCSSTGSGGLLPEEKRKHAAEKLVPVESARPIRVRFIASKPRTLKWEFKPLTDSVTVVPGETALAFFSARNTANHSVVGVATYNIIPPEAAQYFHKIQCFCFEEQRLLPNEEVDLPVFFYIDADFLNDPKTHYLKDISLAYNFFPVN